MDAPSPFIGWAKRHWRVVVLLLTVAFWALVVVYGLPHLHAWIHHTGEQMPNSGVMALRYHK